ncbi:MAG: baseplate J/gp47 family protein [Hyphomicrobiales bacterium]|nr:baseplate J/gp47 family protein [Hyphomicrobiales bacterium]
MARSDAAGPYNLDALRAIAAPELFQRDPGALKDQLVTWFEATTQRKLYPMQVEMLLIDMVAYLWSLSNTDAQFAHVQRYATLADMPWLQHLGAQPGVETPPLPAAAAVTALTFTMAAPAAVDTIIPAGTRASAGSDATIFVTNAGLVIAAGAMQGSVAATAQTAGAGANGLKAGMVSALLDPVAGVATVSNASVTGGGADAETPDAYRLRLCNALEKTAIAGQRMGYVEHAMAVSAAIIDCAAIRPQPCFIDLYPLTENGAATPALRDAIKAQIDALQENELLPMGDLVTVRAVEDVRRPLQMQIVIATADAQIAAAARAAAAAVVEPWGQQLGPRIVPEAVREAVMSISGVVNVETPGFAFEQLTPSQRAVVDVYPPIVTVAI